MTTPLASPTAAAHEEAPLALAALVAQLAASGNPTLALFESIERATREHDPALADAMRACALPRRFDADVVGVLRDAPDDRAENARLVEKLLPHGFVVPTEGGYVYHDTMRDTLLDWWRAEPARQERMQMLCDRLVRHYEDRAGDARELDDALQLAGPVVRAGSPERHARLADLVERRLVAALLEGLYHASQSSADRLYDFLTTHFQHHEQRPRVVGRLLEAARQYFDQPQYESARARWGLWIEYYQARLAMRRGEHARAAAELSALLPRVGDDVKLRLWCLSLLGGTQRDQSRLAEARDTFAAELAEAVRSDVDSWNLPVIHASLGGVYELLGTPAPAAEQYAAGVEAARRVDNAGLQLSCQLALAGVLATLGDEGGAMRQLLESLDLAHTALPHEAQREARVGVAARVMQLACRHDPVLLDAAGAEVFALSRDEPRGSTRGRVNYAAALQDGDQLARAADVLAALFARDAHGGDPDVEAEMLLARASVRDELGRRDEAADDYELLRQRIAAAGVADPWSDVAATTNRAAMLSLIGRLDEADALLDEAEPQWIAMGHELHVVYVRTLRARVLARRGRTIEARALLLDPAMGAVTTYDHSGLVAHYYEVLGDVACAEGRPADARAAYEDALRVVIGLRLRRERVRLLGTLATLAATDARFDEVAARAAEAAARATEVAAALAWRPSEAEQIAAQHAAEAVSAFLGVPGTAEERTAVAHDLLRAAADGGAAHWWYALTQSYVSAAGRDWDDAVASMERAVALLPDWVPREPFDERFGALLTRHAEELLAARRYEAVTAAVTTRLTDWDQRLAPAHRVALHRLLADALLLLRAPGEARAALLFALGAHPDGAPAETSAMLHARLALVAAAEDDLGGTIERLRAAVAALYGSEGAPALAPALPPAWIASSAPAAPVFALALRALGEYDGLPVRRRDELLAYRTDVARHTAPAGESDAAVVLAHPPLRLRVTPDVYPAADQPLRERTITVDLAEVRARVERDTGLSIPGTTIDTDLDADSGTFVVEVYGAAVARGRILLGRRFAAGAPPIESESGEPATLPDGGAGVWLAPDGEAGLEHARAASEDPHAVLMSQLEHAVRANLHRLLDVQEVARLLAVWIAREPAVRAPLRDVAVPDDAALARLTESLAEAAREHGTVHALNQVLERMAAEVRP